MTNISKFITKLAKRLALAARPAGSESLHRNMLDKISRFPPEHAFVVKSDNLLLPHEALSDSNFDLSHKVFQTHCINAPVTQDYRDKTKGEDARSADCRKELSRLVNCAALRLAFEREYRKACEDSSPLCIAFCDIDQFKIINATHGYDAGDRVIMSVARLLQRTFGDDCHLKYGGQEFSLLFAGTRLDQARSKLEIARKLLTQRKLINRKTDMPIGRLSFSGGVADAFAYADPRSALEAADEALHQAKEQGRNRILLAKKPHKTIQPKNYEYAEMQIHD